MNIVVTIPAYNEEKTIGKLIENIHKVMKANRYNYKILVVDDCSKDKTAQVAKKAKAIVYSHPKNYGLADTFRTEIAKSLELNPNIIVHIDADFQYLPEEMPKLIEEVKKGNDLVLGSRFKGKIEEMPLIKRLGNIAFSKVVSQISRMKISDAQTGFRAFTRKVAEKIKIKSNHTYTQEQIIRAVRQKFRIKEVPIYFAKRNGNSRLISNPFEYAAKAFINLVRVYRDFEPLKFFGIVGGFILSIGFILGLWLVYFQLYGGGAFRHIGLMMLDVLVITIGLQLVIFGFIADMLKED
ncbi:glycosyltransferase family 2 protein [Candidatus Woesearchaeota archaeon]|nr:glycosyltransferase family 2 protein [Candidatus Woesearchaeota archaeon]